MGPNQHLAPTPTAMSERFGRVLPRSHALRALPSVGETFPAPRALQPTNLTRPACGAKVEEIEIGPDAGRHRASCYPCGWNGPVRYVETNAQDDADDHNGDGLDIPAAA